jgi:HEAT repeat protein
MMKKFRSRRVLVLAVAIITATSASLLLFERGAFFANRSTLEWAEALDQDAPAAKDSLRAGGTKAVPVLVELLQSSNGLTASNAAEVLYLIGAEDESARLFLIPARKHFSVGVRYWAVRALEQMRSHDEAVPALIDALQDLVSSIRVQAARALGQFGPAAKRAIPELARVLEDRNQIVSLTAAGALVRLDRGQTKAMELLLRQVREDSPMAFRRYALAMLEWLGPAAAEAAPRLRPLLEDPSPEVRQAAASILKNIAPAAAATPVPVTALSLKRLPRPLQPRP